MSFENMMTFARFAPEVLKIAIEAGMTINDEGVLRTGGHLFLLEGRSARNPAHILDRFGEVPPESRSREIVQEKVFRNRISEHVSSWFDRNPLQNQYGGSVEFDLGDFFGGFSGFPEDADEASVLVSGKLLRFASDERVQEVLLTSKNHKYHPLLELCMARGLGQG